MEAKMFCYQCQETMKGTGCILKGVCGKESHTAKAMDLLMFVVRGISVVTDEFRNAGHPVAAEVNRFVVDALFCTITNANFDDESILVSDGKTLWFYNPFVEQATATWLKDATGNTPFMLIARNQSSDWQQYNIKQNGDDFVLTPKATGFVFHRLS